MTNIYSIDGKITGKIKLPDIFSTEYRPDMIQRAIVALQSNKRQSYRVSEGAGLNTSADYFGRRRGAYRQTINRGMSRLPRVKTGGGGLGRVRMVPQSVGGRRAHPPKGKTYGKKLNDKEYLAALRSAIAATTDKKIVRGRGHVIDKPELPIIVEDSLEQIKKTKDLINVLEKLGLKEDLDRVTKKKTMSGKGKTRGRKYRNKKSALIIINQDSGVKMAASNIPGVDVVTFNELDIEKLAPGTHAGRLTVWTKSAISALNI